MPSNNTNILLHSSKLDIQEAPGIYLAKNNLNEFIFGEYSVSCKGLLTSTSHNEDWYLFLDGLFIDNEISERNDAEKALDFFIENGIEQFHEINGFFNILIIHKTGNEFYFVSDLLCSRPWYLYSKESNYFLAPTPLYFAFSGLDMNLNYLALYEQIRLLHTGHERTLVKEIERILPGHSYNYKIDIPLDRNYSYRFEQSVNEDLTLEDCSKEMTDLFEENIKSVLNHPKLAELPVYLPLTGGLDSRHLLGELLKQGKKPTLLRHILIQEKDFAPTQEIANSLEIPLLTRSLPDLDTKQLLARWISRGAGLTNIHQYYLLDLKNNETDNSGISFNGYLMDILIGMSVKTKNLDTSEPHKAVWNRTYSSKSIRRFLFKNEKNLSSTLEDKFKTEAENYAGEPWFRMLMLDLHHRGIHYTGNIDTMLNEDLYSFSPAASLSAYNFASKAPHSIAGDKKAKLHALKKYFPSLSSFKGVEGVPFSTMNIRAEIIEHPISKNLKLLFKSILSGFTKSHRSESEHSWVRNHKDLHKLHKFLVFNSELVNDGHIRSIGIKISWYLNEFGGYQGWTLMSFVSSEIAYRLLVKKQDPTLLLNQALD